jgi:hypothetical protein
MKQVTVIVILFLFFGMFFGCATSKKAEQERMTAEAAMRAAQEAAKRAESAAASAESAAMRAETPRGPESSVPKQRQQRKGGAEPR